MLDPVEALILQEAPPAPVTPTTDRRVLVVDAPALATTLAESDAEPGTEPNVLAYCDSLQAEQQLPFPALSALSPDSLAGVDLVLLRLPKSLAALEEYAQHLALPGVRLVCGGRIKHMTRGMNEVLATRFGEVRASLGQQKSRVLHAWDSHPGPVDFPRIQHHRDLDLTLAAHGGAFAGTRIDPGTRLLISVLDRIPQGPAVDLGCGNGTLAVLLARAGRSVIAVDESRAACRSTAESARLNSVEVDVRRTDGLAWAEPGSLDLVVCNPPFHLGTTKDSSPGFAMIADAGRALSRGGELWLVFNAHLPYLTHLRRLGRTDIVARNAKFIVTRTVRDR